MKKRYWIIIFSLICLAGCQHQPKAPQITGFPIGHDLNPNLNSNLNSSQTAQAENNEKNYL